ncbi:MAG: SsrA-binding protein [Candidatus Nasuia deltocephalinicola]
MIIINKFLNKYNIIKEYNAGIILEGWEVKTLKTLKNIEIKNSYIININNEIFLKNCLIYNNERNKTNNRNRKLLLKKNEIKDIKYLIKIYKMVPLYLYIINNIIKIKIVSVLINKKYLKLK